MHVTTRFFAIHRDIVGTSSLELEVAEGATVADMWSRLGEQYPELVPATRSLMYAVNQIMPIPARHSTMAMKLRLFLRSAVGKIASFVRSS